MKEINQNLTEDNYKQNMVVLYKKQVLKPTELLEDIFINDDEITEGLCIIFYIHENNQNDICNNRESDNLALLYMMQNIGSVKKTPEK